MTKTMIFISTLAYIAITTLLFSLILYVDNQVAPILVGICLVSTALAVIMTFWQIISLFWRE
jgi:hypothetical protein